MSAKGFLSRFCRRPLPDQALAFAPAQSAQAAPPKTGTKSKTWETTVSRIPSWPEGAKPLKTSNWIKYLYGFGDIILVLLPIYFILLGIAVITLNGKPTKGNSFGPKVEFAIDLGPTIFPIIFAAISGRSMKMIARYLAERGARLSTLELLMASQSVWGTVESQLLMQRLTLVGVNLLFFWALSPLGGQASLRLMNRDSQDTNWSTKLRYVTTGPGGMAWALASTYQESAKFADAGALYTAALMAPQTTKTGPQDPWGNVKIPSLEALNISSADSNGWVAVPSPLSAPEIYASLVGIPIVGLPSNGSSNFTLEYTYVTVQCGSFNQTPYPQLPGEQENLPYLNKTIPGLLWNNKSEGIESNPFTPKGRTASFFLDTNRDFAWDMIRPGQETLLGRLDGFVGHYNQSRLDEKERNTHRELIYVSKYAIQRDSMEYGLNMAKCDLAQKHVEAMIRCNKSQCATEKLRPSLTDTRPTALTGFEHSVIMSQFVMEFPTAVQFSSGSSPTERFLSNTSSIPFIQQVGNFDTDVAYTNLSLVPPDLFSRRLSLLLNTYYQLSTQGTGYFGGLSMNLSAYGPDTLPVTDVNAYLPSNMSATEHSFFDWWPIFDQAIQKIDSPFIGATTKATVASPEEIFACNFAWLALLLAASGTIFMIGASALLLKQKTLGPEMFGFVTSMMYENKYVKIPEGGSMLDGMERARLLKDVEVYIGDVHGNDDVGHIALAAGVPLRKLERGRLYC